MNEDQANSGTNAGVAGAWMLFVIMIGSSMLSAIMLVGFMFLGLFSYSRVVENLPTPMPDYPMETPSFPGTGGGTTGSGGDIDFFEPDSSYKLDKETCESLATMSNEEAYKMYRQYCL